MTAIEPYSPRLDDALKKAAKRRFREWDIVKVNKPVCSGLLCLNVCLNVVCGVVQPRLALVTLAEC